MENSLTSEKSNFVKNPNENGVFCLKKQVFKRYNDKRGLFDLTIYALWKIFIIFSVVGAILLLLSTNAIAKNLKEPAPAEQPSKILSPPTPQQDILCVLVVIFAVAVLMVVYMMAYLLRDPDCREPKSGGRI